MTAPVIPTKYKAPGDLLDYGWDYGPELTPLGDSIVASEWALPDGLVREDQSFTATTTSFWPSGGTGDPVTTYLCTNTIDTVQGRRYVRSIKIKVKPA